MKPAKILYFVNGHAPKPEDFQAAAEMAATVHFRNAKAVPNEEHSLEICDGVAGHVPPIYAKRYPKAEDAISKKKDELKALTSKVGDSPAPKASGKAAGKPASAPQAGSQPQAPAQGQQPQGGQPAPGWNPNPAQ